MQNDRYLILTAQLYDAKDMAATAKTKADKAGQRMAQDRIRIIQQGEQQSRNSFFLQRLGTQKEKSYYHLFPEMKQLEAHPVFNPAIKVSDAPQKEKKVPAAKADKEDLGFKLFEQAEKDPPAQKG